MDEDIHVDGEDDSVVHCGRLPFGGGNEYECGVLLKWNKKATR